MSIRKEFIYMLIILVLIPSISLSQSLFGATDHTIGNLLLPYSSAGKARSYEIASDDTIKVNPQNFSLWTNLANTTYSVVAGYDGATAEDNNNNSYYSELFPLKKNKFAMGIGLQPISNIDRRFANPLTTEDPQSESLYLKGGLGRGIFNFSFSPVKSFGIGAGYEYTFGSITENYIIEYEDVSAYRISIDKESRFSGHGIVLSAFAKPVNNLTVGMITRLPVNANVDIQRTSNSEFVNRSGDIEITLPAQYGLGMEYQLKPRLKMGADFIFQDWSNGYKIEDETVDKFHDSFYRFGVGIERMQSEKRYTNLTEQMDFRAGLFYGSTGKTSNSNTVNEYGISLGFSLPVIRYVSTLDISAQIGRRGNLSDNAYEETFYSLGITFSASELWFVNYDD